MTQFLKLNLIIATIILISGCSIIKPLDFKSINSFSIEDGSKKGVSLVTNLTLYNPNNVEISINSADIDVYAEGVNLGKLQIPELIKINKKSEFTGNYKVEINFIKLMLAGKNVMAKLKSGNIEVTLKGKIEADLLWMHKAFIVNHTEKIKIK